jgi:hypothetical protein
MELFHFFHTLEDIHFVAIGILVIYIIVPMYIVAAYS